MKPLLLAAGLLIAGASWSHADAVQEKIDDYMACMIGQSAVALLAQGGRGDADAAQETAAAICPSPKFSVTANESEQIYEGLGDYINLMVLRMAGD